MQDFFSSNNKKTHEFFRFIRSNGLILFCLNADKKKADRKLRTKRQAEQRESVYYACDDLLMWSVVHRVSRTKEKMRMREKHFHHSLQPILPDWL